MKKLNLLLMLSLSIFTLISCNNKKEDNNNSTIISEIDEKYQLDDYIDNLIERTPSYIPCWNQESYKGRWNYIDGVFLNSIIEYSNVKKDDKYKDFVKNYVNYYLDDNGNFLYVDKDTGEASTNGSFKQRELDSYCESRILFDLYDYTNDNRYKNAIDNSYGYLLNMPLCANEINYWHKDTYRDQIFLDGFYMYVPFLSRYAKFEDDNLLFTMIIDQYTYIYNNMRDKKTGLYYQCMDTTKSIFWADPETGLSKSVWARGFGWLLMSLVDSIENFPKDKQSFLIKMLSEAVDSVYKYIDKDTNMFYQLIDKGNQSYLVSYDKYLKYLNNSYTSDTTISNYLESSGSSMIAYTMMKAARLNYIDNKYLSLGKKSFEGICNHSFNKENNSLNDICITAGLGPENKPYRDGTEEYYLAEKVGSNDAKGVGPFITAYIEYIK